MGKFIITVVIAFVVGVVLLGLVSANFKFSGIHLGVDLSDYIREYHKKKTEERCKEFSPIVPVVPAPYLQKESNSTAPVKEI